MNNTKSASGILTPKNISIWYNNKAYVAGRSHPNFDKIVNTYKSGDHSLLPSLFDVSKAINERFVNTNVEIKNGLVYVEGEQVHNNSLTVKIIDLFKSGRDVSPFTNFLSLLWRNPSPRVRGKLFDFLEKHKLSICDDGWFLSFRAVNSDYSAIADKSFKYQIGVEAIVSPERPNVDPTTACGRSMLHIGTFEYVSSYGSASDKKYLLCRVNPENVLSVPGEGVYGFDKICTWKLTPVAEIPRGEFKDFDANYTDELIHYKKLVEQSNANSGSYWNKRDKLGRFVGNKCGKLPSRDSRGRFVSSN